MPTLLTTQTAISGVIRNDNNSLSSLQKIEIAPMISTKSREFKIGEFEIYGQATVSNCIQPISTNDKVNRTGLAEKIGDFTFQGYISQPETVILIDDLDVNIIDAQNYVTVVQEVEVEGSYWS